MDTRKKAPHRFTEEDWNENSPAQLEEKGKDVAPPDAYRASKTLAEKAAWKFVEENKPKWDLVTMCPPLVLGPVEQQVRWYLSFGGCQTSSVKILPTCRSARPTH